jgi:transposase
MRKTSRATLARVNEQQPHELYKSMFFSLLNKCAQVAPRHRFKFKGKIYLLDATTIDLCLAVFPWAKFRRAKGAIKLHMGLDAEGYLPAFMDMTDGKFHEVNWARNLHKIPTGSCIVFDKGFTDYTWYQNLCDKGVFFVTRIKKNAVPTYLKKRPGRKPAHITNDQTIKLRKMESPLRLVDFTDPETGKNYQFLTNATHLNAKIIADLYKERWKIEQFFRWIKQNLKIKTFYGTSKNAVLTQIWIALCVYLLLSFIKFKARLGISITRILRLLHLNLFERRPLTDLLKPPDKQLTVSPQLLLWEQL